MTPKLPDCRNPKVMDKKTAQMLVLIAYGYEEISIGRACELLKWPKDKVERELKTRCSTAAFALDRMRELSSENATLRHHLEDTKERLEHVRGRLHHFVENGAVIRTN